jgi:hypothetical protein
LSKLQPRFVALQPTPLVRQYTMYQTRNQSTTFGLAACLIAGLLLASCRPQPAESPSQEQRSTASDTRSGKRQAARSRTGSRQVATGRARRKPAKSRDPATPPADAAAKTGLPVDDDVLTVDLSSPPTEQPSLPRPQFNQQQLTSAGIRKISSQHLDLYTDLPPSVEVDELPKVFDLAVAQWCQYFHVDPARTKSWRMIGHVMARQERFAGTKLLPNDLPRFLNGYQKGWQFWVYEQPSAYYRRHLVLHEGTHAFMWWMLGSCGPPWYMEGIAEMLATHRWQDGQLTMNYLPQSREEVEQWGRIKIVRDDVRVGRSLSLMEITSYSETAHLRIEPYGWSWAACTFLDRHPDYQRWFRSLRGQLSDEAAFRRTVEQQLREQGRRLAEQWQWYTSRLDYGYEISREAMTYTAERQLPPAGTSVLVSAEHGWQSTGIRLAPGQACVLESSGRYQIGSEPKVWWCESGGVTIEYYRGHPLGVLLAAVIDPEQPLTGESALLDPQAIGLGGTISSTEGGILFLRINEHPARWKDNAGELLVTVRQP